MINKFLVYRTLRIADKKPFDESKVKRDAKGGFARKAELGDVDDYLSKFGVRKGDAVKVFGLRKDYLLKHCKQCVRNGRWTMAERRFQVGGGCRKCSYI